MDKASIEKRIELLKKDQDYHSNMLQMIEGAKQDCNFWLNEIDKKEKEKDNVKKK